MNSYFVLWPTEWCKLLAQAKDAGPLQVIYGGPHTSVPSLGKVRVGDLIYPIAVKSGQLVIIGRMQVERIIAAEVYLQEQNISRLDSNLWDTTAPQLLQQQPELGHRIPRSCVDDAATGNGTLFRFDFEVPVSIVGRLQFGPKVGQEKGLSTAADGKVSHVAFQGHFRRLSADSASLIADLMRSF